jgi:hypothetical protein
MIKAAALLLALLWAVAAQAQVQGTFQGYQYPSGDVSVTCSPTCTGVSSTVVIPTISGSGGNVTVWEAITSVQGDGVVCVANCFAQFGWTRDSGGAIYPWMDFICSGTGCNSGAFPYNYSTPVLHTGDVVKFTALCTVLCNGTAGEQWSVSIADITTGVTCYIAGSTCGTNTSTVNWPISQPQNRLTFVNESNGADTWAPIQWSNLTYTTGVPGSQVTQNVPLSAKMMWWSPGSGGGAGKTLSPSPPGPDGNSFNLCSPVTAAGLTPCSISGYSGSVVGP